MLMSENTFQEISKTLIRSKFDKYLSLEKRLQFMSSLRNKAEMVTITETIDICRDSKDNMFLELAISGQATHIITGDQDLLELHPFRNILIITPSHFFSLFS